MKENVVILALAVSALNSGTVWAADPCQSMKANEITIDKGVCPGEGCQLGDWAADELIGVLDKPNGNKKVFSLEAKEKFTAVYGENHVMPVEVEVTDVTNSSLLPLKNFKKGDVFMLFTNEGEGIMSACFGGKRFSVDCTAITNMSDTCKASKMTWARAVDGHGPKETWWVKVRNASGKEGWIKGYGHKIKGQDKFSSY